LLEATEQCLHRYGLSGLSTRRVADAARMPLSQIHYHFGSKEDLVLALLGYKNERLLNRQAAMYGQDLPLWKRWKQACDYLDEDLSSGYVRVLQEMMAAGWSNPAIAKAVRQLLSGWFALLTRVAEEAAERVEQEAKEAQEAEQAAVAAGVAPAPPPAKPAGPPTAADILGSEPATPEEPKRTMEDLFPATVPAPEQNLSPAQVLAESSPEETVKKESTPAEEP